MFKSNNKGTRTTCSSVSIINFEHVIAGKNDFGVQVGYES